MWYQNELQNLESKPVDCSFEKICGHLEESLRKAANKCIGVTTKKNPLDFGRDLQADKITQRRYLEGKSHEGEEKTTSRTCTQNKLLLAKTEELEIAGARRDTREAFKLSKEIAGYKSRP